ncbi:MAG TPA: hypothetical protein VF368_01255 [Gemmatimonadaceae bacterium]
MMLRLGTFMLGVLATGVIVAPRAGAQRLFRTDSMLTVTITTELGPLLKQRDSLELVKHPAVVSYVGADGKSVNVPVKLRARGHFRRQARNCDFPPLWLELKSSDAKQTVLSGLSKIKIATTCRPKSAEYEQYMLQEYAVYRAYAALTDASFRTRLLRITYRDTAGKIAPITTSGFFLEDVGDLADHLHLRVLPAHGAKFEDLESESLSLLSMFEYFIGSTDWSVAALHNIALLQDSTTRTIPVAYDFDWTGAVDARYAFPDKTLPIHSVTERLYRGNCPTPDQLKVTLDRFRSKHAAIDAVFTQLPQLAPDRAKRMKSFFDDFWKRLDDPRGFQKEIAQDCQKIGN